MTNESMTIRPPDHLTKVFDSFPTLCYHIYRHEAGFEIMKITNA